MNDHELDLLAATFNIARPDWPTKSLRTFLAKNLASRPYRDVFVALAWIACEPRTATPARVLEAGPWWQAAAVEGRLVPRHPSPVTACHNCGGEMSDSCCDAPSRRPQPSSDYAQHAATARALLHADPTPEVGEPEEVR